MIKVGSLVKVSDSVEYYGGMMGVVTVITDDMYIMRCCTVEGRCLYHVNYNFYKFKVEEVYDWEGITSSNQRTGSSPSR